MLVIIAINIGDNHFIPNVCFAGEKPHDFVKLQSMYMYVMSVH